MNIPDELVKAFEIFADVGDHRDLMHRAAIAASNLCDQPAERRAVVATAVEELLNAYDSGGWPDGLIDPIENASHVFWRGTHAAELREVLVEILACLQEEMLRDDPAGKQT
jgi:hypothetical protein